MSTPKSHLSTAYMHVIVRNGSLFHPAVLYVGFQSLAENVAEGSGRKLACVEVLDTSSLLEDLSVLVFTVDGTAQGF